MTLDWCFGFVSDFHLQNGQAVDSLGFFKNSILSTTDDQLNSNAPNKSQLSTLKSLGNINFPSEFIHFRQMRSSAYTGIDDYARCFGFVSDENYYHLGQFSKSQKSTSLVKASEGARMAKRFTDTEKWKNPNFRKLPNEYRWFWIYILDNCDSAGIWRVDFETAQYFIGYSLDKETAESLFADKIINLDYDKWFIPSFVTFQYGSLNSDSRPHQSVIKTLESHGIDATTLRVFKGYLKGINTPKDKDKDKEQDKDKEKDKEGNKKFLEEIYNAYPLKKGKQKGLERLKVEFKNGANPEHVLAAVHAYKADLARNNTDPKYIKHFATFVSSWRDWLDADAGASTISGGKKNINDILAEIGAELESGKIA